MDHTNDHRNGDNGIGTANSSAATSPTSHKRQRAKQACEPCRLRKRRCDGNLPCNMCTQFEYKCYFEKHPRKRSKIVEAQQPPDEAFEREPMAKIKMELANECHNSEDNSKMRAIEANSGIAFTRLLGMRLDPSFGPKLLTFGWNLGNTVGCLTQARPITELLTLEQMRELSALYFANVHPLYGFLNKEWILQQIAIRWSSPETTSAPDHLLCGVAAVGSLFTADAALMAAVPAVVDASKISLESTSTMLPPSVDDIAAWVLRCLHLRATDHPHACWMATSITMHLIEAIGLQMESNTSVMNPPQKASNYYHDPEIRRRTFWVARMLNSWVSFEYGRTRVALRGITCKLPTPSEDDYTTDYLDLYGMSCVLDPERNDSPDSWEDFLKQIESYEPRHDGIMLSKANLALCAYRRLRLANPSLSSDIQSSIINIGLQGLEAARNMAANNMPWWHVANVPFQVTCVLLAMDTRESLMHLSTAMRTLEHVVEKFSTVAMKEALKTARFLIRLSKKRKDEDSGVLGQSLLKDAVETEQPPQKQQVQPQIPQINGGVMAPMQIPLEGPLTTSSGEDWNLDYLNNSDFDWQFFLSQEMPAFTNLAPDGTM